MPRLRKHRREATKLAAKVTANRKAGGGSGSGEKTARSPAGREGDSAAVRFRVEIWKEEPEVRIGHAEFNLSAPDTMRDLAASVAERLLGWLEKQFPKAPHVWDTPVEGFKASDDDISF